MTSMDMAIDFAEVERTADYLDQATAHPIPGPLLLSVDDSAERYHEQGIGYNVRAHVAVHDQSLPYSQETDPVYWDSSMNSGVYAMAVPPACVFDPVTTVNWQDEIMEESAKATDVRRGVKASKKGKGSGVARRTSSKDQWRIITNFFERNKYPSPTDLEAILTEINQFEPRRSLPQLRKSFDNLRNRKNVSSRPCC